MLIYVKRICSKPTYRPTTPRMPAESPRERDQPCGARHSLSGRGHCVSKKMCNFAGMIKSPYRRGADDGFLFGIYLTVMFFASIFAGSFAPLSLLALVMMVSVPVVIYRFMRSYHRSLGPSGTFAMLWMQGVMIFFCGMLIAGTALVVYMKWIHPGFVVEQAHSRGRAQGLDARHTGGFCRRCRRQDARGALHPRSYRHRDRDDNACHRHRLSSVDDSQRHICPSQKA